MPRPSEPVKIRKEDYEAARALTDRYPVAIIDIITAWRILWESSSEAQQFKALRRVRKPEPEAADKKNIEGSATASEADERTSASPGTAGAVGRVKATAAAV